jgi:hypothetical protein
LAMGWALLGNLEAPVADKAAVAVLEVEVTI